MPETPGSRQPLAIMNVGGAGTGRRAKSKAKAKGQSKKKDEDPSTPQQPRKRKGDEELLQIDLKRQAIVMKNNFVAWLI